MLETLRKPRIFGMVVFDTLLTVIIAGLIGNYYDMSFFDTIILFLLLILISIFLHAIFKVDTATNYMLGIGNVPEGLKKNENYFINIKK